MILYGSHQCATKERSRSQLSIFIAFVLSYLTLYLLYKLLSMNYHTFILQIRLQSVHLVSAFCLMCLQPRSKWQDMRRPGSFPTSKTRGGRFHTLPPSTQTFSICILRSNQNNMANRFQAASQVYCGSSTNYLILTGLGAFDSNSNKTSSTLMSQLALDVSVAINIKISDMKGEGWFKA